MAIATAETLDIQGQASQRDIFRLSAILYSEMTDTVSTQEVLLGIIECIFLEHENQPLNIIDLQAYILDRFKLSVAEDELINIVSRNSRFFLKTVNEKTAYYQITLQRLDDLKKDSTESIDYYISKYIDEKSVDNDAEFREAIYRYLYELTTTNINSYKLMFSAIESGKSFKDIDLSVEASLFTDNQLEYIHAFIEWEDVGKNLALTNIVFCCLEYCLLVAGDSDNKLVSKYIKNRAIYLDTNIIFRALGINGNSRKAVMLAFLNKCKQANIDIVISAFTQREFFNTIDYYLDQIRNFPRGKIYLGAYEYLSDYNIYAFYNDWLQNHSTLSLKYFRISIHSAYNSLVKNFNIKPKIGEEINVFSEEATQVRHNYEHAIASTKKALKEDYVDICKPLPGFSHDATLIYIAETKRRLDKEKGRHSDSFVVSSDKALRFWDMHRVNRSYPIVIYPSQLFLMLIKTCGRSENDLNSFVSFINVRTKSEQLSPTKANVILSGISSITEDIKYQEDIVASIFEDEFQEIIRNSNTDLDLYKNVQLYSQNYLDDLLTGKDQEIATISDASAQKDTEIQRLKTENDKATALIKKQESSIAQKEEDLQKKAHDEESRRERLVEFSEKQIRPQYILNWYILPALYALLWCIYVLFVLFQFIYPNKTWNMVTPIMELVGNTWFGKMVDGYPAVIDSAIFIILCGLYKFLWNNPFNKEKRSDDKANRIEKYIKDNHLS